MADDDDDDGGDSNTVVDSVEVEVDFGVEVEGGIDRVDTEMMFGVYTVLCI